MKSMSSMLTARVLVATKEYNRMYEKTIHHHSDHSRSDPGFIVLV